MYDLYQIAMNGYSANGTSYWQGGRDGQLSDLPPAIQKYALDNNIPLENLIVAPDGGWSQPQGDSGNATWTDPTRQTAYDVTKGTSPGQSGGLFDLGGNYLGLGYVPKHDTFNDMMDGIAPVAAMIALAATGGAASGAFGAGAGAADAAGGMALAEGAYPASITGAEAAGAAAGTSTGMMIDAPTAVGSSVESYAGPEWSSEMAQAMQSMGMSPEEISAAQAELGAGTGVTADGMSLAEGAYPESITSGVNGAVDGAGGMGLQEGAYPSSITDGIDWAKAAALAKQYGVPISQIVGGLLSKIAANKTGGNLTALQQQSDPFGPYRKQYADRLNGMVADPAGSVASMPAYQAGIQAIKTAGAGHGYMGSGNMDAAMLKYGGNMWGDQAKFFAGLAGANISPSQNATFGTLEGQNAAAGNAGIVNIIKGLMGSAPLILNAVGRND